MWGCAVGAAVSPCGEEVVAASEGEATSEGDAAIDVGSSSSEDAAGLAPGVALPEDVVAAQLQHNAATVNATTPSGGRFRFLSSR